MQSKANFAKWLKLLNQFKRVRRLLQDPRQQRLYPEEEQKIELRSQRKSGGRLLRFLRQNQIAGAVQHRQDGRLPQAQGSLLQL